MPTNEKPFETSPDRSWQPARRSAPYASPDVDAIYVPHPNRGCARNGSFAAAQSWLKHITLRETLRGLRG